jgi:iron complex transport system permease protein
VASEKPREDEIAIGWTIAAFLGLAVAAVLWAPFWPLWEMDGARRIAFSALWGDPNDQAVHILWNLRIPRTAMAFLAGMALATSGMVFQAMFRNPLATPFTLGISSGASLGAALCIYGGWTFAVFGISCVSLCAFLGAVASVALVYALTTRGRRGASASTMLLAGVAVSFFFSSLILFLQYIVNQAMAFQMLRWVMGGFEKIVQFREVWGVFPFVASGCLMTWYLLLELNLLATGEDFAFSRGVNVRTTKFMLYFGVSLMVGAVVAVCGPIGFVGLMSPHIARMIVGPDHRRLYPVTLLFGGTLLVVCDTAARIVMAPTELPVGILTALMGGPFFLWLLLARGEELDNF